MKRREFLVGASAALACAEMGLTAARAAESGTGLRLKTCVFSPMFRPLPLKTAMETAGAIGYDGIEIGAGYGTDHLDVNCTPERAREIKAMAAKNKLALVLIYSSLGGTILQGEKQRAEALAGVERFLVIGQEMECKMLKVGAGSLKNSAFQLEEARVVANWLAQVCDRAAQHGTRVVTEIHFGQYCETANMAARMIDLVNRPNYGVIHDAGNMHIVADSYVDEAVKLLGQRIFHVHVKDMVKADPADPKANNYPAGRFKRAPLNQGNVNHRGLFQALARIGYNGYLSCEATGSDDPAAVAKYEFAEMQKLLRS